MLGCIDAGLNALGTNVRFPVYWYLENAFGLRRADIPRKPRAMRRALRIMFRQGASVIEASIAAEVRKTFGLRSSSRQLEDLFKEASSVAVPPAAYI